VVTDVVGEIVIVQRILDGDEDIVQETWPAVLRGLHRFEQRSSLRTWVFHILLNKAKTCGSREHRTVPTADLDADASSPLDPGRFREPDDRWPDYWQVPPGRWPPPESEVLTRETRHLLAAELRRLPPRQRAVIELRDVNGYTADETCRMLEVTEVNQRVLLHRARARLRAAIEESFGSVAMELR